MGSPTPPAARSITPTFEWLSEPHAALDDPATPSEQGDFVAPYVETVRWRGREVRVPPLWVQLAARERRGLPGRTDPIRSAMAE